MHAPLPQPCKAVYCLHTSGEELPPGIPERKSLLATLILGHGKWKNRDKP
jgi:hypothetical protein